MRDPLPLTPLQQGMLAHSLQHPGSGCDIEQMVCTLRENLDAARFRAAWERAAQRHDSLRLNFDCSGDEPVQVIQESFPLTWEERDISEEEFPAFLHTDRFTGFDPAVAPLMRFTLLRLADDDWRLVWTFHHLLIDGRSIVRVLHEAFSDYNDHACGALLQGTSPRQFLHWQSSIAHSESLPFWKEHLRDIHGPSAIVINDLGTLTPQSAQAEADHCLCAETTAALRTLAEKSNVTQNTLIQAAWALLISRYTGEESVIFGATRACRHTAVARASSPGSPLGQDAQATAVGLFINTLPVAANCTGDLPSLLQ